MLTLCLSAILILAKTRQLERDTNTLSALPIPVRPHTALMTHPVLAESALALDEVKVPIQSHFKAGENLSEVFAGLGISPLEGRRLSSELGEHVELRRLRPGDSYSAYFDQQDRLAAFEISVVGEGEARVERLSGEWQGSWRAFRRTTEVRSIQGSLNGSLEASIRSAGGSPSLTYSMADALQWDLDFTRDLRIGDRFSVVYEQVFLDGDDRGPGNLLALTYENRGEVLEAYRYGSDGGFYDPEGRPLRKMFLRSPLRYSRITSGFSHRRFHPVLKVHRPHYGVDYGAPVGTPVRATAAGTVVSAGWNRGGGRTIQLRHPNDYRTSYLHLSKFAKGMTPGRRVAQSEVIGYVGATGLATGPHLDYRVKHQGRWINPLSIKSVPAQPIMQQDLPDFIALRDSLRHGLETGEVEQLATLLAGIDESGEESQNRTSSAREDQSAAKAVTR
ncbi:MAG: peptidoglycan DD-metalloendopeptidase family protein [Deltaproteobacteria bacterium]|nr:peptidoglycan DD-metalloendopeptidase family protein [Deltaproteobacteria bacterium]